MTVAIKPAALLRHGTAGLSLGAMATLIEHPDELKALRVDLDGRRNAALAAIKEADAKLAAAEAREAEVEERESKVAELVADLETREAAVALGTKGIKDAVAWLDANPLNLEALED